MQPRKETKEEDEKESRREVKQCQQSYLIGLTDYVIPLCDSFFVLIIQELENWINSLFKGRLRLNRSPSAKVDEQFPS